MAQTYKYGTFTRDDMVGVPESVAAGMAVLENSATPFLSRHSPNLNNLSKPVGNTVHSYFEKQWRALRSTLNGDITAGATSIVFTDKAFKPGELVAIGQEVVELGTTADYLTFANCTRSVGTTAAAAHSSGDSCMGLGKSWTIGHAAATADMIVQPNQVTNYTQIFRRDVGVSGTVKAMNEYHRIGVSRYDANVAEQMLNLKHELEGSLLFGVAQAAVADSTEGRMDGLWERVSATSSADLSGATATRDDIRSRIRAILDYSDSVGELDLYCSHYMGHVIDDWQLPRIQVVAGSPAEKAFGSNVSILRFGGVTLNVVPMAKIKTHIIITTPQFIRVGPLQGREFQHTYLGVDGDRIKGQIVGEYTCEIPATHAHQVLYNVASS